jgi:O-antigen/teichoic acid export membrane protein
MSERKKIFINTIFYTIGEVIPKILAFLLLPILTKYLSPDEYGITNYTNTVMLFFFVLTSLSLNTYVLRNYYKIPTAREQQMLIGNIFSFTLVLNAVVTVLELIMFPLLIRKLHINIPYYPFFMLAILNNFLEGISIIPLVIYRINDKARLFVFVNVSKTFLQFALTTVFLVSLHYGLLSVYLSRLVINVIYAVVFFMVIYKHSIFKINVPQIKDALRFSLPLLPGAISYIFISSFDRIVLERTISLTELGIYSSAATLALALNIVVQGLYRSFEQRIFKDHGTAAYENKVDLLYKFFLLSLLCAGCFLSIFSKEVFLFFTSARYLSAYRLVPFLVVPVIIAGINTFLSTLMIAEGKQVLITKGTLLSAAVTLLGNLLITPRMGIPGAIMTSVVSFLVVFLYYQFNLKLRKKMVPEQLLLLCVVAGLPFLPVYDLTNVGLVVLVKLTIFIAYFVLLIFLLRINPLKFISL